MSLAVNPSEVFALATQQWPKPRVQNRMPCTCREDGAPVKRRCNSNWTRCNARLAAIREWQRAQAEAAPAAGGAR